jgi:sulfite reductase (ferredoxin)
VPNFTGWHEQGDGRWFFGLEILSGRIADGQHGRVKSALREIVELTGSDLVATPDQNIIIRDIDPQHRGPIDEIFRRNDVQSESSDPFERSAMACPALPTCGLALAESERYLPQLLAEMRAAWTEAGLNGTAPTVRMTGCPNGCARPSLGEIGIVGVSADRYNVYIGGNPSSTRLNEVYREKVKGGEIVTVLAPLFTAFASERLAGESFGDYCVRVHLQRPMQPA